jgi:hypothetical protein
MSAGLLAALAIFASSGVARAACDATICGVSPCTITGTHDIDAGCTLDFSGKAVTVAQSAVLRNRGGSGGFVIQAASLVLNGTIRFPNGTIRIYLDGDMSMPTATSVIDASDSKPESEGDVEIYAGGNVTVNRILTSGGDYGGIIQVYGKNVVVSGTLQASANAYGGDIWIDAEQDVTISGTVTVSATGTAVGDAGRIGIEPAGKLRTTSSAALRAVGVNGGSGGDIYGFTGTR